jgi:acyl-CoA synthetase (AMP-forming)/AMP-acid ligase II
LRFWLSAKAKRKPRPSCNGFSALSGFDAATPRNCRPSRRPKLILLHDELPKSERGKLDRKALAAEWNRGRG